jgi:hypothetical protein
MYGIGYLRLSQAREAKGRPDEIAACNICEANIIAR